MNGPPPGAALAAAFLLSALLLSGCVAVRPLDEVRRAAPGRVVEIDGVALHVEDRGSGEPAVVLLHGFGASTWSWRHVIPALELRHRTIAVDLPGFGASDRPGDLDVYRRDALAGRVVGLLDELGLDRVHLVGHSFGGALAIAVAHRAPERLESLVLVGSAAVDYPQERRGPLAALQPAAWLWVRGVALRRPLITRSLRRSFADDERITPGLVDGYRDRLRVHGAVHAFRGLTRPLDEDDPEIRYETIAVPTTGIWGADDELIPVPDARRAVDRFPDSRFVELAGCGHLPMEECPEALAAALEELLSRSG